MSATSQPAPSRASSGAAARDYQAFLARLEEALHQQNQIVIGTRAQRDAERQNWQDAAQRAEAIGTTVKRWQGEERYALDRREQHESDERSQRIWAQGMTVAWRLIPFSRRQVIPPPPKSAKAAASRQLGAASAFASGSATAPQPAAPRKARARRRAQSAGSAPATTAGSKHRAAASAARSSAADTPADRRLQSAGSVVIGVTARDGASPAVRTAASSSSQDRLSQTSSFDKAGVAARAHPLARRGPQAQAANGAAKSSDAPASFMQAWRSRQARRPAHRRLPSQRQLATRLRGDDDVRRCHPQQRRARQARPTTTRDATSPSLARVHVAVAGGGHRGRAATSPTRPRRTAPTVPARRTPIRWRRFRRERCLGRRRLSPHPEPRGQPDQGAPRTS